MLALSLFQPWASLVAIGAKRFETRSWRTHYRGPLLIHAAKRLTKEGRELSLTEPFRTALEKAPYWAQQRGLVLACGKLEYCGRIENDLSASGLQEVLDRGSWELPFGNYTKGRFAWSIAEVVEFPEPFYARGGRRLFHVPDWQVRFAMERLKKRPRYLEEVSVT